MRKLLSFLSIALMAIVSFSCEKPIDDGQDLTNATTFTFGEAEISGSSIEVGIIPSDLNINYCAKFFATSEVAEKDDATIIDECLNGDDFRSRKGVQLIAATGLTPETSYTLVAFALTENSVTRKEFTTDVAAQILSPEEFNVEISVDNITATSAVAKATPNGANRYFFRVITKMELDAMGIYNSDYDVFSYILENPNNNNYIVTGTKTLDLHLNPEMDYLAVAFNVENWEAVYAKEETLKLFRYAFKTPKVEYNEGDLFAYNNVQVSTYGFSVDVIPSRGEDSFWTYYVWSKQSYDDTLATESSNAIVMRSYWALYNIGGEAFVWDFGQFIREYMGQTGSSRINHYEPLEGDSDYVIVLFYMDPEVGTDPTEVYDYKHVAINIHTEKRTLAPAELIVSEPVIVKNGFKYDIQFNVKVSEDAQSLKIGTQLWKNYDFTTHWDPNDWSQIEAYFRICSKYISEDSLAEAKTAQGTTFSITGADKEEYAIFFEALNSEYTKSQFGVHVTKEMFDNAQ